MLNFLPSRLIGVIAAMLLTLNICVIACFLFSFSLLKFLLPISQLRLVLNRIILSIAESWITCNKGWMRLTQRVQWDVKGLEGLTYRNWYLVNSNHQSWVDIFVLQYLLNRRIPLLKFFLKRELIWVPIMGLAWWALDFPFMRRNSEQYLKQHPEMRGKDLDATRRACEKFAQIPTSVMNFLEGTRFSAAKHTRQASPYRHLLKPKAGGIALALNAMGDKFKSFLNITIVYPDGAPRFWDFLCGKMHRVIVRIEQLPIPRQFVGGNYAQDEHYRQSFQQWVQQLWQEKDQQSDSLLQQTLVIPDSIR